MEGVGIDFWAAPRPVSIQLNRVEYEASDGRSGEKFEVRVDGSAMTARVREDLPLSAERWFDLLSDAS